MTNELPLIETVLVNIPKAATNLRGLAQRLMKSLRWKMPGSLCATMKSRTAREHEYSLQAVARRIAALP